ncbi:MAG: TfoX/Sxy family protein [Ginsengibacter sp.]
MAYNEKLADRVREVIAATEKNVEEKKMFGGLCFMVNDKMCTGVQQNTIMLRIDPEKYDDALEKEGCTPMEFTGRTMKGFVYIDEAALDTKKKLEYWIKLALEYNMIAKPSKKKKNKAKNTR